MFARALILSSFVVLTASVTGYFINAFLTMFAANQGLPRGSVYAPLASIIANVIASSVVFDAKSQAIFVASREFMLVQLAICILLIFVASRVVLSRRNPRSPSSAILCSFFVIPGILIAKTSGSAYLHYRVPAVIWSPFSVPETALQIALSMPFYTLLFFAGILILTDDGGKRDSLPASPFTG